MLSKVGMIDAAESTELLTSTINGYKLSVEEAVGVVDKFVAADLKFATSAKEIAVAMQYVASSAQQAGVSIDQLVGLITIGSETTRLSAETIGNAWKTLVTRFTNVKLGKFMDENGEALNNVESILGEFGITLRDSINEWRNLGEVIDEIGKKWDTFSSVEKSAIATQVAGTRQANIFIATMDNYDKVINATNVSMDSAGATAEKYADYLDSIDAKIAQFTATWQEFVNNIWYANGAFKFVISAGSSLIGVLDFLINDLHLLEASLVGGVIYGVLNLTKGIKNLSNGFKNFSSFTNLVSQLSNLTFGTDDYTKKANELKTVLNGYPKTFKAAVVAMSGLTEAQERQILATILGSEEEADAMMRTLRWQGIKDLDAQVTAKRTVATNANTVATEANTVANNKNALSISNVVSSIKGAIIAHPYITAFAAIGALTSAVISYVAWQNKLKEDTKEAAEEISSVYNDVKSEVESNIDSIEDLQERYSKLSLGVDKNGNNVSLDSEEYKEYRDIIEQIIGLSPGLTSAYINENNLLSDQNSLIEEAIRLNRERLATEAKIATSGENRKTRIESARNTFEDSYRENNKYMGGQETASSLEMLISTEKTSTEQVARKLVENMGLKDVDSYINNYISNNGLFDWTKFIEDNWEDLSNSQIIKTTGQSISREIEDIDKQIEEVKRKTSVGLIDEISGASQLSSLKEQRKELENISSSLEHVNNYAEDYASATSNMEKGAQEFADYIQDFSKSIESSYDLTPTGKTAFDTFIQGFDAQKATYGYTDVLGNFISADEYIDNFEEQGRKLSDALVSGMSNGSGLTLQEYVTEMMNISNIDVPVGEWVKAIEDSWSEVEKELKAAGFEDSQIMELKVAWGFDTSQVEKMKKEVEDTFDSMGTSIDTSILTIDELRFAFQNLDDPILTAANSTEQLINRIQALGASSEYTFSQMSELASSANDVVDAYGSLKSITDSYNSTGYLTISQLEEMLGLMDTYGQYLTFENGQLVINRQAMEDLVRTRIEEIKAKTQDAMAANLLAQAEAVDNLVKEKHKNIIEEIIQRLKDEIIERGNNKEAALEEARGVLASSIAKAQEAGVTQEEIDAATEGLREQYNSMEALINGLDNIGSGISASFDGAVSSSVSNTTDAWKEEFEALYRDLQHQREMDLISEEQYFNELNRLNQKYFANRKEYLEDYYKYEEEVYQGLKKLAEDRLEAEGNAAINEIDERIDALEKEKEALNEKYEAEEDELKLQKAKDRYEAAKGQLVNRVYTNERGWGWQADQEEVDEAKEELEEIEREIAKKEQEKLIDDQIEALEDLKEEYQKAMDKIGKSLEENQQDLEFTKEFQNMTLEEMQDAVADYASRVEEEAARVEEAYARMRAAAAAASVSGGGGGFSDGSKKPSSGSSSSGSTSKPNLSKPIKDTVSNIMSGAGNGFLQGGIGGAIGGAISGALKGSRAGGIEMGAVDFTGPLMVHGTPDNPEYVLTSRQMENLVKNMSRTIPEGRLNSESKSEDIVFTNCKFELPNVKEPNNFIPSLKQLAKQNRK